MSLAIEIEDLIPGNFVDRENWNAPAEPGGNYRDPDLIETMTGHITTGNNLGRSDTKRWVKNIYDFHTGSRGWSDIGYAFLYDRYGNVFEGRGVERELAHAKGYNRNFLGVAYLGAVSNEYTAKARAAFLGLRQALANRGYDVERVNGHRDLSNKGCPGDPKYDWIQAGMPWPDSLPEPGLGEPSDEGKPDFVVAVIADNEIDEGMGRVLGKAYQWKFIHARDLSDLRIGTAVLVGASARLGIDDGPWEQTHRVSGANRDETALLVKDRIRAREGDSRSVT